MASDLELAAEFCRMVQCKTLYEYLGLPEGAPRDHALYALQYRRGQLDQLVADVRYKPSADYLNTHYDALAAVLSNPGGHSARQRRDDENMRVPMLEMAVDGILADGRITAEEREYAKRAAMSLGISEDTFGRVLEARAKHAGVSTEVSYAAPVEATPATVEPTPEPAGPDFAGATGAGWWDATFTRILAELIPGGPGQLVDLYCRRGLSAQTLLPHRPQLSFVGVDPNADRLSQAQRDLAHLADRAQFRQGQPWALPLPDASVDYVLSVRALENVPDTTLVMAEAYRVLRPGGRFIAVEPDGVSENFYFDEHLIAYNAAFRWLCKRVDDILGAQCANRLGKPGMALGPKLATRMTAAGFEPLEFRCFASQNMRIRHWRQFSRRLREYAHSLANRAGLPTDTVELMGVLNSVNGLEHTIDAAASGLCGHVLPLFLVSGRKPS